MIFNSCRNSVDASRFGMIVALPSFVVSGFYLADQAMPQFFQPDCKILPQTWFSRINYFAQKPGLGVCIPILAFGIVQSFATQWQQYDFLEIEGDYT